MLDEAPTTSVPQGQPTTGEESFTKSTTWPGSFIDCPQCPAAVVPRRDENGTWVLPEHRGCPAGGVDVTALEGVDVSTVIRPVSASTTVDDQVASEAGGDMRTCRPDKPTV